MHHRSLIIFKGCIMDGNIVAEGTLLHDGERLELEKDDGSMIDITNFIDVVERPLSGRWAEKYPHSEYYIETP